jgi:hypothetical protein
LGKQQEGLSGRIRLSLNGASSGQSWIDPGQFVRRMVATDGHPRNAGVPISPQRAWISRHDVYSSIKRSPAGAMRLILQDGDAVLIGETLIRNCSLASKSRNEAYGIAAADGLEFGRGQSSLFQNLELTQAEIEADMDVGEPPHDKKSR